MRQAYTRGMTRETNGNSTQQEAKIEDPSPVEKRNL